MHLPKFEVCCPMLRNRTCYDVLCISLWNTQDHQHTVLGTCMRVLPLNVFASSLINRSRIAEEGEMVLNGHKSLRTKEK